MSGRDRNVLQKPRKQLFEQVEVSVPPVANTHVAEPKCDYYLPKVTPHRWREGDGQ